MANRNDRRRNAKRARKEPEVELTLYSRPPDGECETSEFPVVLDDSDFQIVMRLVRSKGRLVEFAIILCRLAGEEWREIYSVDTMHGQLHEHTTGHQKSHDRQNIKPLFNQVDVQESFDEPSYRMVHERYLTLRG